MDDEVVAFSADLFDACAALFAATFSAAPWHEQWTVELAQTRLADLLDMPPRCLPCLDGP